MIICKRAIYFAAYSTAKEKLNGVLEPDSTQVHMVSAGLAGNDGSSPPPFCLFVTVFRWVLSLPVCLSASKVLITDGF